MKKSLLTAILAGTMLTSTCFAAANPFTDVPKDHWSYDAIVQLAQDGVIEGYGDNTFKGDKNITRYEAAQMIAKAMTKADINSVDRNLLYKLQAEYAEELNNLGVRVANLEKNADKVKWTGEVRGTAEQVKMDTPAGDTNKNNDYELMLRLEPTAEVNDHWSAKARTDAYIHASEDSGYKNDDTRNGDVKLKRIYAEGNYDNLNVKLGKVPFTVDNELLFDGKENEFSGASVTFGNKLKATIEGGRFDLDRTNDYIKVGNKLANDDPASFISAGLQYTENKGTIGAGYHYLKSDALKNTAGYGNNENANIWSVNAGYAFDKNVAAKATYANNTSANNYNNAYSIQLNYKGAQPENAKTWGMYAAYRKLGQNVAFDSTYNGAIEGTKGWEVGTNYTFAKNIVGTATYYNGKQLDNNENASKLFGRLQFFF